MNIPAMFGLNSTLTFFLQVSLLNVVPRWHRSWTLDQHERKKHGGKPSTNRFDSICQAVSEKIF